MNQLVHVTPGAAYVRQAHPAHPSHTPGTLARRFTYIAATRSRLAMISSMHDTGRIAVDESRRLPENGLTDTV